MIFYSDQCSQFDRIYENVNSLALGRNSVSFFPRSLYKSGNVSDPNFRLLVGLVTVLIPYKLGSVSDLTSSTCHSLTVSLNPLQIRDEEG